MSQFAAQPQAGSPAPQQTPGLDDPLLKPAKRGTARSFRLLRQRLTGAAASPPPAGSPSAAEQARTHADSEPSFSQPELVNLADAGSPVPADAPTVAFDTEGLIGSSDGLPPIDVDLSASEAPAAEHPLLSGLEPAPDTPPESPDTPPESDATQPPSPVGDGPSLAEAEALENIEPDEASLETRNLKMLLEPELPAVDEFAIVDVREFSEPASKETEKEEADFEREPEQRFIEGTRPAEFRFWETAVTAAPAAEPEAGDEVPPPEKDPSSGEPEISRSTAEPAAAASEDIDVGDARPAVAEISLEDSVTEVDGEHEAPADETSALPKSSAESRRRAVLLRQAESEPSEELGEVARSLLDIMSLPANATQPQERALAADSLLHLVHRLPVKTLVAMAERVSFMEAPPPLIMAELIHDPRIEVAGPLLEKCSAINDQDLIEVIADGLVQSNRMIARRRSLSAVLCDALIATEDTSAILTLVRNPGAMISHEAFYQLNELAKLHPTLQAPLATRSDLPAPVAFELFWVLPGELRRYVISRFLTDSTTLNKILKLTQRMDADQQEATADRFSSPEDIDRFLMHLHAGRVDEAEQLMSALLGLEARTAKRILADPDGEPLTVALKAMGATRARFEEAFSASSEISENGLRPRRSATELQSIFESLSFNKARVLLTYWDWAISRSGPYAALSTEANIV
jgi:Uncharacterised protein conserved in bacteria (DUF2336)